MSPALSVLAKLKKTEEQSATDFGQRANLWSFQLHKMQMMIKKSLLPELQNLKKANTW